jgi:hypothetical protein
LVGTFPVPITVVPGHLAIEEILALAEPPLRAASSLSRHRVGAATTLARVGDLEKYIRAPRTMRFLRRDSSPARLSDLFDA